MMKINISDNLHCIKAISKRELGIFNHRPLFLFTMIIAPLLVLIFFTTLMNKGLPTKLPAAIVDEDNTHVTRIVGRIRRKICCRTVNRQYLFTPTKRILYQVHSCSRISKREVCLRDLPTPVNICIRPATTKDVLSERS